MLGMKPSKFIFWSPRILSLALVAFISLFAFDVFDGPFSWWMILAFFIHLLPSFILLAFVVVAWRCEVVGAVGFLLFALWYCWQAKEMWVWSLIIAGPSLVIAYLYYKNWVIKGKPICR